MLKRLLVASATIITSLNLGLAAQAPATTKSEGQSEGSPAAEHKLHIEGCVFPKRALTSAQPVTVYAGSSEEYVVTDTKVISASPGVNGDRNFIVQDVPQERLRQLIGQRVGVTGRVQEKSDVPQLQVISMIETVGSCPRIPTPRP